MSEVICDFNRLLWNFCLTADTGAYTQLKENSASWTQTYYVLYELLHNNRSINLKDWIDMAILSIFFSIYLLLIFLLFLLAKTSSMSADKWLDQLSNTFITHNYLVDHIIIAIKDYIICSYDKYKNCIIEHSLHFSDWSSKYTNTCFSALCWIFFCVFACL